MKTKLLALMLALAGLDLWAQTPPGVPGGPVRSQQRVAPEEMIPAGTIHFESADVNQVLDIYAQLVGRTLLRPASSQ